MLHYKFSVRNNRELNLRLYEDIVLMCIRFGNKYRPMFVLGDRLYDTTKPAFPTPCNCICISVSW